MTKSQAQRLAKQIFDRFGHQIREAVRGTIIPPEFIAGLVANEAGKDRQGNIKREATRFEKHVYARLRTVSRTPGARYGQIRYSQLKDASDDSLRALAHSYEATQMMGYWCIVLGCTLADLKNPEKHFFYTVKLLLLNDSHDFNQFSEAAYDDEMRQWNTGREKGKTYHENYVPNARLIRAAYRDLERGYVPRSVEDRVNVPVEEQVASTDGSDPAPSSNSSGDNEQFFPVTDALTSGEEQSAHADAGSSTELPPTPSDAVSVPPVVTEQQPGIVSTVKGWWAALPAAFTSALGGLIAWIQGAATEIIIAFFVTAGVIVMTWVICNFVLKNKREARQHEANEKQRERDFILTKLQMESAMDDTKKTVLLAPPATAIPATA